MPDPLQTQVLVSFDALYTRITTSAVLFRRRSVETVGIYLWGGVGIGKTLIMDCFYQALQTQRKRRCHFYIFMRELHDALREYRGKVNPLFYVAKKMRQDIDVLCFDEFFIKDIVDAMLFCKLLPILFKLKIFFVTTSNAAPDNLYPDGLQRQNLLPTLALLKEKLEVIHLRTTLDYRLRSVKKSGLYYTPIDTQVQRKMEDAFRRYTGSPAISAAPPGWIMLLGRRLPVIQASTTAVWFDFFVLCGEQRCQQDYLALTERYCIIFLSNVPVLTTSSSDSVTRFIQLIDILYDANTTLILSAAVAPRELYEQGKFRVEFQRTISRLIEMADASH